MEKGIITIGIEYYTDLVREHAIMESQIVELKRFLKEERVSRMVYAKDVARIFGFELDDPAGYQE